MTAKLDKVEIWLFEAWLRGVALYMVTIHMTVLFVIPYYK